LQLLHAESERKGCICRDVFRDACHATQLPTTSWTSTIYQLATSESCCLKLKFHDFSLLRTGGGKVVQQCDVSRCCWFIVCSRFTIL